MGKLSWSLLWSVMLLSAQALRSPEQVLTLARERVLESLRTLPRYTCVETINRSIFRQENQPGVHASCDNLIVMKRRGMMPVSLIATDRLRLDVAVGETGEIFSWAGAKAFESGRLDDLVAAGPLGTGPFGPFLMDTFGQPGIAFHFRSGTEYWFRVPRAISHYRMLIGGKGHFFPYDGTVQIDAQTADLLKMTARTGEVPLESGVCEATTNIDFQQVRIGQGVYLLPSESRLRFVLRNGDETENVTSYASCHEFRGEATLRFDEPGSDVPTAAASPRPVLALSAGIPVSLSLETPIYTDTSAAGDELTGTLLNAISDQKTGLNFPRGSTVHGRIRRLEHHIEYPHYFRIAIAWDAIQAAGESRPFAARFSKEMQKQNKLPQVASQQDYFVARSSHGEAASDSFIIQTRHGRDVMPQGLRWNGSPSRLPSKM